MLGKKIQQLRKENALSQEELASKLYIPIYKDKLKGSLSVT